MERVPILYPPPDDYKLRETLEAAQEELVKLLRERESMEWKINKLQNDIVHLAALCRVEVEDPIRQLGLTDAVRWVFSRDKNKSFSVKEIVSVLERTYRDASTYKNLHANVHTIFRRLRKAKEIVPSLELPVMPFMGDSDDQADRYVWGGGLPPLPKLREINEKF